MATIRIKKYAPILLICLSCLLLSVCNRNEEKLRRLGSTPLTQLKKQADKLTLEGKTDSAMSLYAVVADRYSPSASADDKSICASAHNNLGYLYFFKYQNFGQSLSHLLMSENIASEAGDSIMFPYVWLNMANIYLNYNDLERSREYYKKAYLKSAELRQFDIMIPAMSSLIIESKETSADSLRLITDIYHRTHIPDSVSMRKFADSLIGYAEYLAVDSVKALQSLLRARHNIDSRLTTEYYRTGCDLAIARLLIATGNHHRAEHWLRDSVIPVDDFPTLRINLAQTFDELYDSWNKPDSALKYRLLTAAQTDSLYKSQQYGMIRNIDKANEVNKLTSQVEGTLSKWRLMRAVAVTAICGLLLIVGILIYIVFQNKKLRQRNISLYERVQADITQPIVDQQRKYNRSNLDDSMKENLLGQISTVMENNEIIFSPGFTIDQLSEIVGCRSAHLSQVINECLGVNFNSLLQQSRINEACRRLASEDYDNYSIEGVAVGVGFKSRSNFVAVFKKITGLTPSEYRRASRNAMKNSNSTCHI